MKLLLVRHAESQGNFEHRLQGRREYPLTERGVQQAQALGNRLQGARIAAVYASPISRAMNTAEIVAERIGVSVVVESRLQEYDFGETVSGLTWSEIREKQPALVAALRADASDFPRYPGEEGRSVFKDRVCNFFGEITAKNAGDESVLVVTHAGPIVVFVLDTLGREYGRPISFTIDSASITTVEFNAKSAKGLPEVVVTGINDTCHLAHVQAKTGQEA